MKVGEDRIATAKHPTNDKEDQPQDEPGQEQPTYRRTRSRSRPPFMEIGRLTERETKHGTVYLGGEILGLSVYIFPREDGSWRIFTPGGTPDSVQSAGAARANEEAEPMTEYTHTLDDVVIPDPGEPVRQRALQQPEPTERREGRNPTQKPRNRTREQRKEKADKDGQPRSGC
jgi:hypothetical protein